MHAARLGRTDLSRMWNSDFFLIIPIKGLMNGKVVNSAGGSLASCVSRSRM